jgi:hypothetical protein
LIRTQSVRRREEEENGDAGATASEWERQRLKVQRDVRRTFSSILCDTKEDIGHRTRAENLLKRTLYALVPVMNPTASASERQEARPFGYCQGMNLVVGLIVAVLCLQNTWTTAQIEEIAFWLTVRIYEIEIEDGSDAFSVGDAWLRSLVVDTDSTLAAFEASLKRCTPKLHRHLSETLEMSPLLFAPSLIGGICVGFAHFDVRLGLATLDLLIANVRDAPIRIGIAALAHFRDEILSARETEMLSRILSPPPAIAQSETGTKRAHDEIAEVVFEGLCMSSDSFGVIRRTK